MIIIGTMDWTSNVGSVTTYCPNCGVQKVFRVKNSRPFLTLYFIPCIPLDRKLEYLQCASCRGTFGMDLLEAPKGSKGETTSIVPFEEDLIRAMATIMLEDGGIDPAEILASQFAFQRLMGKELSREDLGVICDYVTRMKQSTINFLRQSEERWDDDQKTKLVQAMFWTASATGSISAKRTEALTALGRTLNISEERYKEIIAMTLQWNHDMPRRLT